MMYALGHLRQSKNFFFIMHPWLKAYFTLPDWGDDLNIIPEEKDDDQPDAKALEVSQAVERMVKKHLKYSR